MADVTKINGYDIKDATAWDAITAINSFAVKFTYVSDNTYTCNYTYDQIRTNSAHGIAVLGVVKSSEVSYHTMICKGEPGYSFYSTEKDSSDNTVLWVLSYDSTNSVWVLLSKSLTISSSAPSGGNNGDIWLQY